MQNKYLNLLALIAVVSLLFSCNPRKEQEKQADLRLKHIAQLVDENSLNTAKIEIDSIHLLFPRLVEKRKAAEALKDTIVRRESARTLAYCDSILPFKQQQADSIQKNFRLEKNTVYQQFGSYIYKTQRTENNATRTYLKSFVDENADFFLISNYCGAKIDHVTVRVSVNDLFAQTDTIATTNAFNHSFSDGGTHWEAITFKNEADKGVAAFIDQYYFSKIKVTLYGKKPFVYNLSDGDKKAISQTYHLWVVKKDVAQLQKEIKKATMKIERINKRKLNQ